MSYNSDNPEGMETLAYFSGYAIGYGTNFVIKGVDVQVLVRDYFDTYKVGILDGEGDRENKVEVPAMMLDALKYANLGDDTIITAFPDGSGYILGDHPSIGTNRWKWDGTNEWVFF